MTRLYPFDKIILKHLQRRGTISPMEALTAYGTPRLAPKIHKLRLAGFKITTQLMKDEPGHRYARYTLKQETK